MSHSKFMIYAIHHKDENYPAYKNNVISPIMAGELPTTPRSDITLNEQSGDTIKDRQYTFSEFTIVYWIWKNTTQECTGIMHYRRALNLGYENLPLETNFCIDHGLTRKQLELIFHEYDIVGGNPENLQGTIFQQYKNCHPLYADDVFRDIRKCLIEFYPDMVSSFDYHFYTWNQPVYFKCQIIAKKEAYHAYCTYMFKILFYLEGIYKDKIKGRQGEFRFYAFIGERLYSLFIYHHMKVAKTFKVRTYPIAFYEKLSNFNSYRTSLKNSHLTYANSYEPDGYLRNLFYHQNLSDTHDRRVSANINYKDHNHNEYSAILVKHMFHKHQLNKKTLIDRSNSLYILDKNQEKKVMTVKSGLLALDTTAPLNEIVYQASGNDGYYHAHIVQWNEPGLHYHLEDKTKERQQIFLFKSGHQYRASDRLYVCQMRNNKKQYLYIKCQRTNSKKETLTIVYDKDTFESSEITTAYEVTCFDKDGKDITISIQNSKFLISNNNYPQETVTLQDWDGNPYEIELASWFYMELPYPIQ